MIKEERKVRNSNIELLRIIAMVLIVMHHYSVHGFSNITVIAADKLVVDWFATGGKIGVDVFVLISGYYMVNSTFNLKKLLKIWGQVWFYAVGIFFLLRYVLAPQFMLSKISAQSVLYAFFPVTYNEYWFASVYIWLMLLTPVLNMLIHQLKKEQLFRLILVGLLLASVLPSIAAGVGWLNEFGVFVLLYIIAGYIRLYAGTDIPASKHLWIAFVLYVLLQVLYIGTGSNIQLNGIFVIAISIELLIGFAQKKPSYHKLINVIASAAFGVYLIHDNQYVRSYLWGFVLRNQAQYGSGHLIVHALISVFLVYVVCTCIDLLRQYTVEKAWLWFTNCYLLAWGNREWNGLKQDTMTFISACTRKLNGQHFFMERRTQITYIVSLLITLVVVISGAVIVCVPQLSAVYGAAVIYRLCTYIIIALCLFLILHLSLYKMIWNVEQAIHSSSNVKKTWGRIIGKAVIYCFVIVLICVLNSISGYQTFMDLLFKGNVTECALLLCFALLGILLSQNNQISSSGK
jgi:Uncharacterized protein conserved in bacteria